MNEEFGFTLDAASSEENYLCNKYFTVKENGLKQSWKGETVWCNPSYARGVINKWVEKCWTEAQDPETTVVALLPASTDTLWFHKWIYEKAKEIRFIKGRLKFDDGKSPAPFGSMVVVF